MSVDTVGPIDDVDNCRANTNDDWCGAVPTRTTANGDGCRWSSELAWNVCYRDGLRVCAGPTLLFLFSSFLYTSIHTSAAAANSFTVIKHSDVSYRLHCKPGWD